MEVAALLSERAARCVDDLRARLGDGFLTGSGLAYERCGVGLPLDVAVAIALHDLDDLLDRAASGLIIGDWRWRRHGDDLEQPHHLAASEAPG